MSANGYLVLESGEIFTGLWHGGIPRAGEVVFNTSHAGYEEIATDPSYYMQIMVMTAPMMGNYGSHDGDWESSRIWIQGFVCVEMEDKASGGSWRKRLLDANVPILSDINTRKLVLRLRDQGTPWGALVEAASEEEAAAKAKDLIAKEKSKQLKEQPDWTQLACVREPKLIKGLKKNGPRLAVVDFGIKQNILNCFSEYASELQVFPSATKPDVIRAWNPDALVLSNGPGDPADVRAGTETIRALLGWKPMYGICMGHQTLALALGGQTYKLKFGHRGGNHPVRDQILNKIYITSQNHGYAVKADSLPPGVSVTHTNLYDGTVEGIESAKHKCISVQFHPEAAPGPHDANRIFKMFMERWL